MTATTGYQAGVESNAVQISYGLESVYGTAPATAFQAIRLVSESLNGSKTRTRPSEINMTRESSAAVTSRETAGGAINYALSYATFDDFFSVVLGSDWGAAQTIAGSAGDITITNVSSSSAGLSSTTSTKFQNLTAGMWIRLIGFTNATNNGFFHVTAKADNSHLTLATPGGATVTETPFLAAAQVRAQTIVNGTTFKSLFLQKKFSSSLWMRYPGAYVNSWTLTGGVGQFLQGSFGVIAQQELNQTSDASTGGVTAAPTGKVFDPVGGFYGVLWNDAPIVATVDSFNLSVANTDAAPEYGMGSSVAAGLLAGTIEVTGSIKLYFKDFTIYARFKSETAGSLSFIAKDAAGNAYVVTLPNALLVNPQINAGGPGTAVYSTFTIEGDPQAAGGTIQIDKLPAT